MTTTSSNFKEPHFGNIPLACVIPSKTNPRRTFNQEALEKLADSIKQHGLGQPILVRPLPTTETMIDCVEIIAGERRYRASKLAGVETIPAIVKEMSDAAAAEFQLIENIQREDVNEIEEAEGFDALMKEHGYTAEQLAQKIGMSKSHVYARLKLCALCPEARQLVFERELSASIALLIARIPVSSLQIQATQEIIENDGDDEPMSYREAKNHIEQRYMLDLSKASFSIADAKLVKSAGSCEGCPKRTGNQPEVFSDIARANVCTDPDCFAVKRIAQGQKMVVEAKKKGIPILETKEATDVVRDHTKATLNDCAWNFDNVVSSSHSNKRLSDLLTADQLPEPSAIIKKENGEFTPVFEKSAMQAALEKAGICESDEAVEAREQAEEANQDPEKVAAQQARVKQAEAEREANQLLAEQETKVRIAILKKIRENHPVRLSADALRIIARDFAFTYYCPSVLGEVFDADFSDGVRINTFIDTASAADLQVLLVGMVAADGAYVRDHEIHDGSFDENDGGYIRLCDFATAGGVDIDQVRAELAPPPVDDASRDPDPEPAPTGKKSTAGGKKGSATKTAADTTISKNDAVAAWPFPASK
jgi:ParB/RepB/Spo0J family partition protein